MAEYWKSLPRKFCDICKCWFADNKASIDFHERGKRHKENAQKRIQEIQKRGIKEFKKQQELENEMEKIEKAALAAYKKDLQNMQGGDNSPSAIQPTNKHVNSTSESSIKPKSSVKKVRKKQEVIIKQEECEAYEVPNSVSNDEPTSEKVWYEAATDEGHKYYWNSETSESQWEPPEEGYISIEEQNQASLSSEAVTENSSLEENVKIKEEKLDETEIKEEKSDDEDTPCSVGPQPRVDPYGQWFTVEKKEPIEYDLQLPKVSENAVEVVIPIHRDDSLKIKEKVVGRLSDADCADVTFKKRKFTGSLKRNTRQRTTDDD